MEVGIDIEQNLRFKNISPHFVERVFDDREIEYAKSKSDFSEELCSFWCVKEAVIKAFSNKKISLNAVCVLHDKNGKPFVEINKTLESELKKLNLSEIKISLSHTKTHSIAVCVLN